MQPICFFNLFRNNFYFFIHFSYQTFFVETNKQIERERQRERERERERELERQTHGKTADKQTVIYIIQYTYAVEDRTVRQTHVTQKDGHILEQFSEQKYI